MTDPLCGNKWQVRQGDCIERLRELPDNCVQCVVTSPPYWGLRDYGTGQWEGGDPECEHETVPARGGRGGSGPGAKNTQGAFPSELSKSVCGKCGARRVDGQLGLENTPEEYVAQLVEVFAEVRRVLRDDGVLWLNLGDSYCGYHGNSKVPDDEAPSNKPGYSENMRPTSVGADGLKPKDLVGIPWRVALALQADGWYLRSDIIWAKPNPMPESVTDRPTKAHEYVFLLTKQPRYWYDADAVREPAEYGRREWSRQQYKGGDITVHHGKDGGSVTGSNPETGRNRRTVWTIATAPFPEAHFATYPPALVEPCVLAGSSDRACSVCGAAWVRQVERTNVQDASAKGSRFDTGKTVARDGGDRTQSGERYVNITTGFAPGCTCDADTSGSLILDPFCGSGTTGAVAVRLGRRFLGIELNPEYVAMSERRIGKAERARQPSLFAALLDSDVTP